MAINKNKRIIWTNEDYEEWKEGMLKEEGESEETLTYERYHEDCEIFFNDEKDNLDIDIDGVIVCFASLGLWNGRHNGAKTFGTNVRNILSSNCDYITWYCDRYNVRCDAIHHDGDNHYLYRIAKDAETAERLVDKIAYGGMTEEQFRKATKSLRPYVSEVYGWG